MKSNPAARLMRKTVMVAALLACWNTRAGHGETTAQPATQPSTSGPRMVLIIRHAEKPDDTGPDRSSDLSSRGFERAAALAHVIPEHFPRPDFLLATKRSAHSNRPIETIEPLAKALNEKIEAEYADDDFAKLAKEVLTDPKFSGKTVLIAWHHGKIPQLAHALGATAAPDKWNSALFNRVWEIKYQDGNARWQDLPQQALAGDADK